MEPTEVVLSGTRAEQRAASVEAARDGRFWVEPLADDKEPVPQIHGKVYPWAEQLRSVWKRMARQDREHDLIYENRQLRSGGKYHPGVRALQMAGFDTSRLFVTTSIVETFKNRLARRKSLPMFVVDDAEWSLKRKAQEFRRWLHGKLMESKYDRLRPRIILDALVRGDGVVYVDETDDDVFIERVHRSELLIDPYEAEQGTEAVRTMHRFRTVSRDALLARFPDHKEAIMAAPAAPERGESHRSDWLASTNGMGQRDVIDFVEAWHLPSGSCGDDDEETDGRYVACLANATLVYNEWRDERFPFPRLSCFPSQTGFWGRGIVEMLRGEQMELNRMVGDISMNIAATGKGIWVVPENFDMPVDKLSGYRPYKLSFRGPKAPEFYHPVPVSQTGMALIDKKIEYMHNHTGCAQWFSTGRSPLGAGASGVALDTQEDSLSDRHAVQEEDVGHYMVDVSQCLLDAAGRWTRRVKKSGEKGRKLFATWMDKGRLQRLDFGSVAMRREQYQLQLEPVNFLTGTRAGKLAQATELAEKGVIPQEMMASLFDEPDIAHTNRLILAPRRNAERMMEDVGDETKPLPAVEEWHPLDLLLELTKQYFNRAQSEGAPEEIETRYREFGDMVLEVMKRLKGGSLEPTPPPMDPAALGGAPPGLPPGPPAGPPGLPPDAGMPAMDPAMAGMMPPGGVV